MSVDELVVTDIIPTDDEIWDYLLAQSSAAI